MTDGIIARAMKKAAKSSCRYRLAALGLNRRGEIIYSSNNKPRFGHHGGSIHAEMDVMHKAGPSLYAILLCCVRKNGKLRPMHPCLTCAEKASELGVKIYTIRET